MTVRELRQLLFSLTDQDKELIIDVNGITGKIVSVSENQIIITAKEDLLK